MIVAAANAPVGLGGVDLLDAAMYTGASGTDSSSTHSGSDDAVAAQIQPQQSERAGERAAVLVAPRAGAPGAPAWLWSCVTS